MSEVPPGLPDDPPRRGHPAGVEVEAVEVGVKGEGAAVPERKSHLMMLRTFNEPSIKFVQIIIRCSQTVVQIIGSSVVQIALNMLYK